MTRLLLDEMFSDTVARHLRDRGHDVIALIADPALVSSPDSLVLAHAAAEGRALVTRNIRDFMPLDASTRAGGASHAGLVLVSTKAFPDDRRYVGALIEALDKLLVGGGLDAGTVVFLQR